jgi:hypothetical protein
MKWPRFFTLGSNCKSQVSQSFFTRSYLSVPALGS